MWAATGGYEAISKEVFPRLKNIDRLLLDLGAAGVAQ
jgi:hypothetical protein